MSGVQTASLGEVATFVRGINFKPDDVVEVGRPGTVACMRTKNVQDILDLSDVWGVPDEFVRRKEQHLQEGDLLISSANSWNLIGKCSWVPLLPWRASFGGFVSVLRASPDRIDPRFLYRWFSSGPVQATLRSFGQKTTNISNLNLERCRNLRVPVPPLAEQRRIAAILDMADSLRTKRRAAIAQLDSLIQSVYLDMFGDPASNPKGWPRIKLEDLIESGPQNGLYKPATDYGSGTPILRIDAFYDGVVTKLNGLKRVRVSVDEATLFGLAFEDIVINRVNSIEYLGKSALIPALPEPTVFESNMMRFKVRRALVNPGYVVHFLQTPFIKTQILSSSKNAVNQSSINQQDVKGFFLNVPPLPLQEAFAARVKAVETLKVKHYAVLALDDALFASLQHRAFRGELTAQSTQPTPRAFAELGQLDAGKGLEALVYAARRLWGKGHYWPLKAQYFAERRHLERHGRSLYGETHVAMPHGPVPQAAYNASRALAEGELICEFPMDAVRAALRREGDALVALRDADHGVLGVDERESLDWAIRYVADMSFEQLKTASHDTAWHKTPANMSMAWRDIIESLAPAARQRLLAQFE